MLLSRNADSSSLREPSLFGPAKTLRPLSRGKSFTKAFGESSLEKAKDFPLEKENN